MNTKTDLNNSQEPETNQNNRHIGYDFIREMNTAAFWKKMMPRSIIIFICSVILDYIFGYLFDSMVLLLVCSLFSSGATVFFIITCVSYFKVTKKFKTNLELFEDCGISIDIVAEELTSATMIDDDIGYTESFLVLPRATLIPFDSMVGMKIINDMFETVIYIDGKRRKFSMRVMRKKIDHKIEKILNINKAKLSPYFKLEIGQADYSE